MAEYKLISADSHVSEPPDLWTSRVDKQYRERAPRLVIDPPGREGAYFIYEGHAPHPIGIGVAAGKCPGDFIEHDVDDALDVALKQVRVGRSHALNQFGLDHDRPTIASLPPKAPLTASRVPKRNKTVKPKSFRNLTE